MKDGLEAEELDYDEDSAKPLNDAYEEYSKKCAKTDRAGWSVEVSEGELKWVPQGSWFEMDPCR